MGRLGRAKQFNDVRPPTDKFKEDVLQLPAFKLPGSTIASP